MTTRKAINKEINEFMKGVRERNPGESEFYQAVDEFVSTVMPWYLDHPEYRQASLLERMTEPDRIISFRVTWEADDGTVHTNRAWRVQFNNDLGPYKGGLRFHPTVNQSVLKFLGFEQIFKNALTGLPMGGAKGGANFNPKGKSDREIMRFCHTLMSELQRYIGEDIDVPAGDIGVGSREIGYLFGKYNQLQNRWSGALTGKSVDYGGSLIRKEATGYGCIYFCEQMLNHHNHTLLGKHIAISGSGNVAIYAAEKALEQGAKVISLSDSGGTLHFTDGLSREQLAFVKGVKEQRHGRCVEVAQAYENVEFYADKRPWDLTCDVAMPCATQNELDLEDAMALSRNGVIAICEGANMPLTSKALDFVRETPIIYAPGKAANAGGVAVSGLEQSQNSIRVSWPRDQVDARLLSIVKSIHNQCVECGTTNGAVDYLLGANVAGISKVAKATFAYGIL